MKQPELGKRLKEARISRKMTQSEVVGTFITRNMLSQIESGNAMPSVKTLQYLAEVLDIPPQTLISQPLSLPEAGAETDISALLTTKEALRDHNYATVLQWRASDPAALDDEFSALLAQACCGQAERILDEGGSAAEAASLAREAMELSHRGIYANDLLRSQAMLLFNRAAAYLTHQPGDAGSI